MSFILSRHRSLPSRKKAAARVTSAPDGRSFLTLPTLICDRKHRSAGHVERRSRLSQCTRCRIYGEHYVLPAAGRREKLRSGLVDLALFQRGETGEWRIAHRGKSSSAGIKCISLYRSNTPSD